MKNILTKVTQFLIDNNTQIFLSSILLFIATVSYTRYTEKERLRYEKYDEMTFRVDSITYENYKLENDQMVQIMKEDSLLNVSVDTLK